MAFSKSIETCFSKYLVVDGRASRSEYWWFALFTVLVNSVITTNAYVTVGGEAGEIIGILWNLVMAIPSITVATRRLHDVGKSGWNQLWALTIIGIPFYLYWVCRSGHSDANKYGDSIQFE